MAKSLRSKIKKRFRTLKRKQIEEIKGIKDKQDLNQNLQATIRGLNYRPPERKNAFKNPNDPNAAFPQYKKQTLIDLRSQAIPFAGLEFSGAYRKKIQEPEELKEDEVEIEEIQEENQEENQEEIEEEPIDIGQDFAKIKISGKKKIKKSEHEKEIIYLKTKEVQKKRNQKKSQRACKKSRRTMKF